MELSVKALGVNLRSEKMFKCTLIHMWIHIFKIPVEQPNKTEVNKISKPILSDEQKE